MAKPKLEYRKTEIVVSGKRSFPLDMLRYDSCVPRGSEDVSKIDMTLDVSRDRMQAIVIRLNRFSGGGSKAQADRWASFGWEVIEDSGT